jgi:hypothetical protein
VYVEGAFDAGMVSEVLKQAGCSNAAVYEISTVDVPLDILAKHGLPDGNKGRVIALCLELDALVRAPKQVTGLVDRDYDAFMGRAYTGRLLTFTDYACMEMYCFEEAVLERFCRLFVRKNGGLAAQLVAALAPVLQDLFFIRTVNEVLQLGLTWLDADKQCVVRREGLGLELNQDKFVQKYLNKGEMISEKARFDAELVAIRAMASGDVRHHMHGHDFICLLAKCLHTIVRNKNLADADVIERALPAFVDHESLREAPMFAELIRRVSS